MAVLPITPEWSQFVTPRYRCDLLRAELRCCATKTAPEDRPHAWQSPTCTCATGWRRGTKVRPRHVDREKAASFPLRARLQVQAITRTGPLTLLTRPK